MHTIINSLKFQEKIKGKYDSDYIESICEKISDTPRIGKKITSVNNLFKLDIGYTINHKYEYNLIYCYEGKNIPIFIINIYKKKEKDILSKIISNLIEETSLNFDNT